MLNSSVRGPVELFGSEGQRKVLTCVAIAESALAVFINPAGMPAC